MTIAKAPTGQPESQAQTYRVLSPLNHDGVLYQPGEDLVAISAVEAEALLAAGVIRRLNHGPSGPSPFV